MITVMYTCRTCKREKVKVSVRDRDKLEDLKHYLDSILYDVKDAHELLSPKCVGTKVDLLLPLDGKTVRGNFQDKTDIVAD